jgi:PPM family protein phosphatase
MSPALTENDLTPTLPGNAARPAPPLAVRSAGLTAPGRVRPANEDQFLIAEMTKSLRVRGSSLPEPHTRWGDETAHLFVVADGMGGHQAGEQASAIAVLTIEQFVLHTFKWFFHLRGAEEQNVLREFQAALRHADARVYEEAMRHPEFRGMGTTVTLAYCLGGELFVAHVGDSRCYLFREGALHQVTHDHTLVAELVSRGHLAPEQAAGHQLRHVITNVVGGNEPGVRAELHKVGLEAGDCVLLCSDGLSGELNDEQIAAVLAQEADPQRACQRLVAEAEAHGGRDNITVIVARFDGPDRSGGGG